MAARTLVPQYDLACASYPRGCKCCVAALHKVRVLPYDDGQHASCAPILAGLIAVVLACVVASTAHGENGSPWFDPSVADAPKVNEQALSQSPNTNVQMSLGNGQAHQRLSYENWQSTPTIEIRQLPFGATSSDLTADGQPLKQSGTAPPAIQETTPAIARQPAGSPQSATSAIPLRRAGEKDPRRTSTDEPASSLGSGTAPWMTTLSALAIVLGTLFLFYWGMKRLGPKTNQMVPNEVVEMLGYSPLSGRQRLCLIRLGRKLVLVAVSSDSVEPLTEVDDPVEVDRLVGLCASQRHGSVTHAFQQVFSQYVNGSSANG